MFLQSAFQALLSFLGACWHSVQAFFAWCGAKTVAILTWHETWSWQGTVEGQKNFIFILFLIIGALLLRERYLKGVIRRTEGGKLKPPDKRLERGLDLLARGARMLMFF